MEKPFSKLAKPFAIGLKPLDAEAFLQIDEELQRYTSEKRALYEYHFDDVCMAEPETRDAQREAAQLIIENLRHHHHGLYDLDQPKVVASDGHLIEALDRSNMPLAPLALLIQDDLVLMRRDTSGWRLAAASLCFPSSWNLREKFGRPLEAVHGPVPMPKAMSERINRIFDNLQPDIPVWRENWSLDDNGDLRHDRMENHREHKQERLTGEVYLRREFQTLHKLPRSGDILFTIRIKADRVASLTHDATGREELRILHQQYWAMSDAERSYKGIQNATEFLSWLESEGAKL